MTLYKLYVAFAFITVTAAVWYALALGIKALAFLVAGADLDFLVALLIVPCYLVVGFTVYGGLKAISELTIKGL